MISGDRTRAEPVCHGNASTAGHRPGLPVPLTGGPSVSRWEGMGDRFGAKVPHVRVVWRLGWGVVCEEQGIAQRG